jgi:hypothetical protein
MLPALMQRQNDDGKDQLLRLYWNRADVKRELVSLKREHYELLEKLEQREGEIFRAQSQLEGLERLLTNPLAAANAMVYFQLRHMWRVAALKMEQFARELKTQREQRERTQLHNSVLAKRNRRQDAIKSKLRGLQIKRQQANLERTGVERRLESMSFLFRLFTGPRLKRRIVVLTNNEEALDERINEFHEIVERIQGEPLPEPDGLSLESRRLINVAVIALAQHLVIHFEESDLARLARKAGKRSVADMRFGDRRVCDEMVERIRARIENLENDRRLPDKVKLRADDLVNRVQYRNETDATPIRSGLAEIQRPRSTNGNGAPATALSVNVLEDDYWELSANLL